jgi:hypothetical protein
MIASPVVLLAAPSPATPSACCALVVRYSSAACPDHADVCALVDSRYASATPPMLCAAPVKLSAPDDTDDPSPPCNCVSGSPRNDTNGMNHASPAAASPDNGFIVEPSNPNGAPGTPNPGATHPLARTASLVDRKSATICAVSVSVMSPKVA